jgi:hypothetical protein
MTSLEGDTPSVDRALLQPQPGCDGVVNAVSPTMTDPLHPILDRHPDLLSYVFPKPEANYSVIRKQAESSLGQQTTRTGPVRYSSKTRGG